MITLTSTLMTIAAMITTMAMAMAMVMATAVATTTINKHRAIMRYFK